MGRRRKDSFEGMDFTLEPETKRGIAVVLVFALSAIMFLALFGLAGPFGKFLDEALATFLGKTRFVLATLLAFAGLNILFPDKKLLRPITYVGVVLAVLGVNGLLHAFIIGDAGEKTLEMAGGALGVFAYQTLYFLMGRIAAIVVLFTLAFIAASILSGISIAAIFGIVAKFFSSMDLKPMAREIKSGVVGSNSQKEKSKIIVDEECEVEEEESEEEEEEEPVILKPQPKIITPANDAEAPVEEKETRELTGTKAPPLLRPKQRRSIAIPLDLLDGTPSKPTSGDVEANLDIIKRTFANFGIEVEMGDVSVGPTVTQYTFKPADGVKLNKITGLGNDLSLALAAHPIRIEAPIPGKSLVGIEVPNKAVATVRFRDIIASKAFQEASSPLTMGLGKDVSGKSWTAALDKMPHLLVAGQTGSGKSVCLNTIILSLMYKCGPDDLKMILVDPKRVEMSLYNGIPYLLTPVVTDVKKTVNALKWAVQEMDRRYEKLQAFGARDIKTYNEKAEDGLPYLVIVIDELADLMSTSAQEVEASIVRLAQMSRAVGIHLILATQRPSVNVITGLIKANIPGRIAFAVASSIDSRTILDQPGADKLLGRGDMLMSSAEMATPKRLQGAFVSDDEIRRVCQFLKNTCAAPEYDNSVIERQKNGGTVFSGNSNDDGGSENDDGDPLLEDAMSVLTQAGKASASLLQRRLKVGYSRAARLLDILEQRGFIGPADGARPREILVKTGPVVPNAMALNDDTEEEDEDAVPADLEGDDKG
ncbi:MAG: DNA translocase FtsK [bacterium]